MRKFIIIMLSFCFLFVSCLILNIKDDSSTYHKKVFRPDSIVKQAIPDNPLIIPKLSHSN